MWLSFFAIIGVLVAISIPVFGIQLEKARDAVTVANLRNAYAQAQVALLTEENDEVNGVTYTANADGTATVKVTGVIAKGSQAGFSGSDAELPFTAPADMGGSAGTYEVTFHYDANGKLLSGATGVTAVPTT